MKRFLAGALVLGACAGSQQQLRDPLVRESSSIIAVRAVAPTPPEVADEAQARVLACEAAAALGQTHLLDHVLKKKAASGKPLAEAEIPHIEVQRRIRTLVRSAEVLQTKIHGNSCTVTLAIKKSEVRAVLREAK